jgi:signal transduction histidine kinase
VYRIAQEALTNVRRHAGPGASATVRLAREGEVLTLEVLDDGRGAAAPVPGHGLAGMRERAAALGGTVTAGPAPGGGFRVAARIPVAARVPV